MYAHFLSSLLGELQRLHPHVFSVHQQESQQGRRPHLRRRWPEEGKEKRSGPIQKTTKLLRYTSTVPTITSDAIIIIIIITNDVSWSFDPLTLVPNNALSQQHM